MRIVDETGSSRVVKLEELLKECDDDGVEALKFETEAETIYLIFCSDEPVFAKPPALIRDGSFFTFTSYEDFEKTFFPFIGRNELAGAKITRAEIIFTFHQ